MDKPPFRGHPWGMKILLFLFRRAPWALWMGRLRHPTLFKIAAGLAVVTWLVPDPIPLVDELMFTSVALWLANWKRRRSEGAEEITRVRIRNAQE